MNEYKNKFEIVEAPIAKLKRAFIDINLEERKFLLYIHECKGKTKFRTSFNNKNGQRPKSHKTSILDLAIGFVIYASKKTYKNLAR